MGLLVDGLWQDKWYETNKNNGRFIREDAQFRHTISPNSKYQPQAGRYHLYVSYACPWAHRTLIFHHLKQLEALIGVTVVSPDMLEHGWEFGDDPLYQLQYLHQLYTKNRPQ